MFIWLIDLLLLVNERFNRNLKSRHEKYSIIKDYTSHQKSDNEKMRNQTF